MDEIDFWGGSCALGIEGWCEKFGSGGGEGAEKNEKFRKKTGVKTWSKWSLAHD